MCHMDKMVKLVGGGSIIKGANPSSFLMGNFALGN